LLLNPTSATIKSMREILICIPTLTGNIRYELEPYFHLLRTDPRYKVSIVYIPYEKPVENAMNQAVKVFLKGKWDYFINIDDDTCPTRNILDLIELDKDVIGLPYLIEQHTGGNPFKWAIKKKGKLKTKGLQQVEGVGAGGLIIARRVLQAIYKPFTRETDDYGIVTKGLDFNFCEKAIFLNFKVYTHWDYPAYHKQTMETMEISHAFHKHYTNE